MSPGEYPHMFSPLRIGDVVFKNRVFTAPSMTHMIQSNQASSPEPSFIENYLEKAKGGVACVSCGGQKVTLTGRTSIHTEFDITDPKGWRNFLHMTDAMHFYDAKCSYELIHFGSEGEYTEEARKGIIYGCSDFVRPDGLRFHQMPLPEMEKLADRYAELAERVRFCGFDSLLLHGGHGTLLQEFISPRGNFREDAFGGSMENRARFPLMVLDRIRERVGRDLLIEYRISGSERVPGGFEIEDCIAFTKLVQDRIDILHVSAGVVREPRLRAITHPSGFLPPACNAYLAAAVKADPEITLPVLAVGAFQDPDIIEETLAAGRADLVAMARGTIADPYTVKKAKSGKKRDIVPCIKCFHCLDEFKDTHYYSCSVNPLAGREGYREMLIPRAYDRKKVAVIGGGPGGMYAALLAAERGHRVTLYERSGTLGGQLCHVDRLGFKYDLKNYRDYLIDHVTACGAVVNLGTEASPEVLMAEGFDSILCAIGARPFIPPLPGVEGANVIWAGDALHHPEKTGERIVVIGGGQVGCETAVHFAAAGRDVTVMEIQAALAPDAMRTYREELQGQVGDHCSAVLLESRCSQISGDGVAYTDKNGGERTLAADTVILAVGMKSRLEEAETFRQCAGEYRKIGDCARVGNVKHAIRDAFAAVMTL